MQETQIPSLGGEDPLEKEMSTHSSILAWEIPWTYKPGERQSMGLQRIGHNLATKHQQQSSCGIFWRLLRSKALRSCPTLCKPTGCSPPGSSVHGILQARILEWVAISFSRDLPDPGIEPESPEAPILQADSLLLSHQGSPLWRLDPYI